MGAKTGIKWTDSTYNSWHGCTKVSDLACAHCYAESVNKRAGGSNWGHGAPRRLLSGHTRNEPMRWQKQADKFHAEHGRDRRVFTGSMCDILDNEVDPLWIADHFETMERCDRLLWQPLTKRIPNLPKMIPGHWHHDWPKHIGWMITVCNQAELDRDVPRLVEFKERYRIPWVGISLEPAMGPCDFGDWLLDIDWVIWGGESGGGWRQADLDWARDVARQCKRAGAAFFFKQVAAFRPTDEMIPADLLWRREFPKALQGDRDR